MKQRFNTMRLVQFGRHHECDANLSMVRNVPGRTDTMRSVRFLTRRRVSASTASLTLPTAWSSSAIERSTPIGLLALNDAGSYGK